MSSIPFPQQPAEDDATSNAVDAPPRLHRMWTIGYLYGNWGDEPHRPTVFYETLTAPYVPVSPEPERPRERNTARASPPPGYYPATPPSVQMVQWDHLDPAQLPDDESDSDNEATVEDLRDEDLDFRKLYRQSNPFEWATGHAMVNSQLLYPIRRCVSYTLSANVGVLGVAPIPYIKKSWSLKQSSAYDEFLRELALFKSSEHLKPLQTNVAPGMIGVYMDTRSISFAMEVPHGSFWIEACPDMPLALKQQVMSALAKLHERGILHGNLQLYNIWIGADARVQFIDFSCSRSLHPIPECDIRRATKEELEQERIVLATKLDIRSTRPPNQHEIPHRFMMPGQSPQQVQDAIDQFRMTVEAMEALRVRNLTPLDDYDPYKQNTRKHRHSDDPEQRHVKRRYRDVPPEVMPLNPYPTSSWHVFELSSSVGDLPPACRSRKRQRDPIVRDFAFKPSPSSSVLKSYERNTKSFSEVSSAHDDLLPAATSSVASTPIKIHDYAHQRYPGIRGWYVPHPPTENRMSIDRVIYIRGTNSAECLRAGLPYFEGDMDNCVAPFFKRSGMGRSGRSISYGTLKRRRDAQENAEGGVAPLLKKRRFKLSEEDYDLDLLQSNEYLDIRDGPVALTQEQTRYRPANKRDRTWRPKPRDQSRPRGILRNKVQPRPTPGHRAQWSDQADLCYSPKLGPIPLPLPYQTATPILGAFLENDEEDGPAQLPPSDDELSDDESSDTLDGTSPTPSVIEPKDDVAYALAAATLGLPKPVQEDPAPIRLFPEPRVFHVPGSFPTSYEESNPQRGPLYGSEFSLASVLPPRRKVPAKRHSRRDTHLHGRGAVNRAQMLLGVRSSESVFSRASKTLQTLFSWWR